MKRSLTSFVFTNGRMFLFLGVVALIAALGVLPYYMTTRAQIKTGDGLFTRTKSHEPGLPNYDIRDTDNKSDVTAEFFTYARNKVNKDAAVVADIRDGFVRGEESLRTRLPHVKFEYNTDLRVPEVITPDVWKANIEWLSSPSTGTRAEILRNFVKQNNELIGVDDQQANALKVAADYENPNGNMSFAHLEQLVNGIPVFRGEVKAGFTKDGQIIRVINNLAPGLDYDSLSTDFRDPLDSVKAAYNYINLDPNQYNTERDSKNSTDLRSVFGTGDWATTAEKMYFPTEPGVAVAAWRVHIWLPVNSYYVIVDAETGTLLWRKNTTEDQTQSATYNVYNNANAYVIAADNPAPLSPGPLDPTTNQQGAIATRSNVTLIGNEAPNTFNNNGWITDGANITDGNALEAGIDRDGTNGVDAPQTGAPNRTFSSTWNPPPGAPPPGDDPLTAQAQRGAVIQMFYVMNRWHDRMYQLGFTEQARNFQASNFGRGGAENDRVSAEGQDSSGTNNANFNTPADGSRPRMQMFLWTGPTPDYDGTADAEVIIHEVSHGLSNRLHGNSAGLSTNMSRGMGEGWGDFYGYAMLAEPADPINGVYTTGGYATFQLGGMQSNYYHGIRRFPRAPITLTGGPARPGCGNAPCPHNPFTFKHANANCDTTLGTTATAVSSAFPRNPVISTSSGTQACDQVHNLGEIWSSALWEVRNRMVARLGFAPGTTRVLQVVTDGMKLAPAGPTFLQERDAIIAAAAALPLAPEAAADVADVREGFRVRGMGFSASIQNAGTGANNTQVTEAFDVPNAIITNPITVSDSTGDNDGFPEPGESLLISVPITNNSGGGSINNVNAQVTGGGGPVSYGNIADGATATRQLPYTVPAGAACGSVHQVTITGTSDLGALNPQNTSFTLGVPVGGPPVTFNGGAIANPGAGTVGVAAPYPSTIAVAGLSGSKKIVLELTNLNATFPGDMDWLLVGPGGQKYIVLSDAVSAFSTQTNATIVLRDDAAATLPTGALANMAGSWRPTNHGANDAFAAPAPAAPYTNAAPGGTDTLASVFGTDGATMNGNWSLYGVDDVTGDVATISGWRLTFEANDFNCSVAGNTANLGITKTDGVTTVNPGQNITYTIVASNAGPGPVTGATVTDNFPVPALTNINWTCVGANGGTCPAGGAGNINALVNLPVGGTATFTATATVAAGATFGFSNTATIAAPQGTNDPVPGNNSARDTDTVCTTANIAVAGTNTGAIPDGTSLTSPAPGAPREVQFNVAGLAGAPTAVDVDMTFGGPNHTFVGDVVAVLIAPNGASHSVFGRTLATTATSFGDSSDLGGLYTFNDAAAAPPSGGWWQAATAAGAAAVVANGTYRTTASGGAGAVNPQPPTNMNAAFAGIPTSNGQWILRFTDVTSADTGAVQAANLRLTGGGCPTTAATATVSGRVLTADGYGLRNAIVTMTDSTGMIRTARTSAFGYYTFEGIEVGGTYVVSVGSKQFVFTPRTLTVNDNVSEFDFIAQGSE